MNGRFLNLLVFKNFLFIVIPCKETMKKLYDTASLYGK